jgi:hypothetical protein
MTGMVGACAATMVRQIHRPLSVRLVTSGSLIVLVAWSLVGAGCGGGGGGPTGGGGSGGGGSGNVGGSSSSGLNRPCTDASRVGTFAVELLEEQTSTSIAGGIRTGVLPANVWQQVATAGDCRLIVGPTLACNPACTNPQICAGQNQCIDEPRYRGVGNVTVTGLGSAPVALTYVASNASYYADAATTASLPYPPAAAGASITLTAAGGDLPGFTLAGRGVQELQFDTPPGVMRGQAPSITWVAPAQPGASHILASLDIAHHGGVAARIECDFADDGSAEIPATLIDQLIERGTAGFPELTLTRRTVDSTTIAPGCVEFQVASVIARVVTLCLSPGNCIVSCSEDAECPTGQTCASRKCGT